MAGARIAVADLVAQMRQVATTGRTKLSAVACAFRRQLIEVTDCMDRH
jgi:hypothetical protein